MQLPVYLLWCLVIRPQRDQTFRCSQRWSAEVLYRLTVFAVGQQFDGLFGKWTLDERDRKEVLSYRAGLTVATAGQLTLTKPSLCAQQLP